MNKNKRDIIIDFLNKGMTLISIDATKPDVIVPENLRESALRLNISYNFGLPIYVGLESIVADLTFKGKTFTCTLPLDRVWLAVSHVTGQPELFVESMPPDMITISQLPNQTGKVEKLTSKRKAELVASNPNPEQSTKPRAKLTVVK